MPLMNFIIKIQIGYKLIWDYPCQQVVLIKVLVIKDFLTLCRLVLGSYEFLPGLSYSGYKGIYYYGGQVNGVFRLNDNKHNYRLGNGHSITSWIARNINDYSSLSVRLDYNKVKDIEGADSTSAPSAIVTWDSSLQSREVLDILFGVNIIALGDDFGGGRLAFEFGMPIYQKIDGPALKNDYKIILGLQYSF